MTEQNDLAGSFTLPGTSLTVNRMGYGAMQLAGPHVFGPPRDPDEAIAVLREAVKSGVNHIDTSDYYGPHVTNQIIKQALHPYPKGVVIVTKLGDRRGADASCGRCARNQQDVGRAMEKPGKRELRPRRSKCRQSSGRRIHGTNGWPD